MCGRFTVLTRDEIADVVESMRIGRMPSVLSNASPGGSSAGRAQARPGSEVDAISRLQDDITVQRLVWGFQVPWSKRPVINTRLESALGGTAMWEGPIRAGRCIVPAATFFEPLKVEVADPVNASNDAEAADPANAANSAVAVDAGRIPKVTYEFSLLERLPILLAGVQEAGRVSVVTTAPNADIAPVHPRMPLILSFEEAPLWIEGELSKIAELADRSAIRLMSAPEAKHRADSAQLSLF